MSLFIVPAPSASGTYSPHAVREKRKGLMQAFQPPPHRGLTLHEMREVILEALMLVPAPSASGTYSPHYEDEMPTIIVRVPAPSASGTYSPLRGEKMLNEIRKGSSPLRIGDLLSTYGSVMGQRTSVPFQPPPHRGLTLHFRRKNANK